VVFVIPYFIPHLGCPHQCLFCDQNSITGTRRSYGEIGEQIESTIKEWLPRRKEGYETHFAFYGGSFTCLPASLQNQLLEKIQPWIERSDIQLIRLSTRPDCLSETICDNLREHRVGVVELGVQSLDDRVLQQSLRGHSEEQCGVAVDLLHQAGITVGLQLMPGLPGESRKSFKKTIKKALALDPAFVRLYPALVVEGSGLAELYRAGEYQPLTLEMAVILVHWALKQFKKSNIRVVRMGLQPTPFLEENVIAGPYHPAFGELVLSREWYNRVSLLLAQNPGKNVHLTLSERDLSSFNGNGKSNILRFTEKGLMKRLRIFVEKNKAKGSMEYVIC